MGRSCRSAGFHDHIANRCPAGRRDVGHAITEELEDGAATAAYAVAAQQLQHDILRLNGFGQPSGQLDSDYPRTRELEPIAGHRDGDVQPARPDGEHAERTGRRRMRVGTNEQLAGPAEAFQVDVVRYAVAGR